MAANDVSKGGSFYLQSKVYRAKEMLDEYLEEKKKEERTQADNDQTKGSESASDRDNPQQQKQQP